MKMVKAKDGRKRVSVPVEIVAWIDSRAQKLGMTREEYVDRLLHQTIMRLQGLEDELSFREKGSAPDCEGCPELQRNENARCDIPLSLVAKGGRSTIKRPAD